MKNGLLIKTKIKQAEPLLFISFVISIIMSTKVTIEESIRVAFNSFHVFWVLILLCYATIFLYRTYA